MKFKHIIFPKCPYCGRPYTFKDENIFLSPMATPMGYQGANHLTNPIKLICPGCGKTFFVNHQDRFYASKAKGDKTNGL